MDIVDRIVRKDMQLKLAQWLDGRLWAGDPRDYENRVPMEFHLQRKCFDAENSEAFVEVRSWAQNHDYFVIRVYVAYCPHGDLHETMYLRFQSKNVFPEPFLWAIFEALAIACVVMEQGNYNGTPGWKQIVHRDIKPGNVFLDSASNQYPLYATPKLADFGLAFETTPGDPTNPHLYAIGAGTRGFKAPEQLPFVDMDTGEPVDDFKLLGWTNVWAIGVIMLSMVNNRHFGVEDQLSYLPTTPMQPPMTPEARTCYSGKLCDLIDRCTQWRPEERITAWELAKSIDGHMKAPIYEMDKYVSAARNGDQQPGSVYDVMFPQDEYKLGYARPSVDDPDMVISSSDDYYEY